MNPDPHSHCPRPTRDSNLLWIALAILLVDSLLIALAIHGLSAPRLSFPIVPKSTVTAKP